VEVVERVGRSVWVVGQDKESGSRWAVGRDFLRHLAAFCADYHDLHGVTVTRGAEVAVTRVNTAPREARRMPFGPSGERARRMAAALVLALIALAGPVALGRLFGLRITLTDSSAPAGIYRLVTGVPVVRGALVAACLPAAIARTGLVRGYLRKGDCRAGAEPVAKVIGAVAGDMVDLEQGWVAVNAVTFANSRTAARDSAGRPLPHVAWGSRRVHEGEVWLFGFNDSRSWDCDKH
jgi:conjugative transfer signal peptidase TraF